jgi:excisionase family DNA binding protein
MVSCRGNNQRSGRVDAELTKSFKNGTQLDLLEVFEEKAKGSPNAHPIEPFYTLKEAADQLNVKPWHLRRMAKCGELRLYRVGSGRKRVLISELVSAIKRCAKEEPNSHSIGRPDGRAPSNA